MANTALKCLNMIIRTFTIALILTSVNTIILSQEVKFPFKKPSHYTIKLQTDFVDTLYEDVKKEFVSYLKENLNEHLTENHFCFENKLSDSVYYYTFLESAINMKYVNDSLKVNPAWKNYDPNRIHRMYRYTSYHKLEHPSILKLSINQNDSNCLAQVVFSRLYEHEDFILGEIFIDWKHVNMDIKHFRLLCFELRDWKTKRELRFGNTDEILTWDW